MNGEREAKITALESVDSRCLGIEFGSDGSGMCTCSHVSQTLSPASESLSPEALSYLPLISEFQSFVYIYRLHTNSVKLIVKCKGHVNSYR